MEHVGIDLGGRKSQVCVRSADGEIIEERLVLTHQLAEYMKKRPQSRVILETCAEAFAVADKILALGLHEVRIVPATLVKTLGVGSRGVKNDRKDARVLSQVSTRIDLPSVHIPSTIARDAKSLSSCREGLVHARTLLINVVHGWTRTQLIQPANGATRTFPARVRKHAATSNKALPDFIEVTLKAIDGLSQQLLQLDSLLSSFAKENDTCRLLMTAPIGKVTAVRFVAALDDIKRFSSGADVANYLGLTPGEHRSSLRGHQTGITKAGPGAVRSYLVQSCWSAWRTRPDDPLVKWAIAIYLRSGKKQVAVVAMARKLAGILFAMWRDGAKYDPDFETNRRTVVTRAA